MPKKTKKNITNEELAYFALGVASMGQDQVTKLLKGLVKTKKLTAKNQSKMHKDLVIRGKREYAVLIAAYKEALRGANKAMKILASQQPK